MKKNIFFAMILIIGQADAQQVGTSGGYGEQHTRDSAGVIVPLPGKVFGGEFMGDASIGSENIEGQGMYLASHFAFGTEKLLISISNDGIKWNLISTTGVFTPDSGSFRDPSIMYRSGRYWVTYTPKAGADNNYIAVISSADLINWSYVASIDLSAIAGNPPAEHMETWAPEWFIDGDSVRVYVSIGEDTGFGYKKIYEVHPTNAFLTTWSAPSKVFEITSPPQSVIDPFMVKVNSTYYLWFKNDSTDSEYIGYATNDSATGMFTLVKSGNWAGWNPTSGTGTGCEGLSLVKVDSNTWRIYFEQSRGDTIFYSESSDNFATWTTRMPIQTPVYRMQHPTILRTRDIAVERNVLAAQASAGAVWGSKGSNKAFLWFGGTKPDTLDFNGTYITNVLGMSVGTNRTSPFQSQNPLYFSSDDNTSFRAVVIDAIRNTNGSYSLQFWKSRGTNTARTQTLANDRLGTISAQGWKSSGALSNTESARIDFFLDDNCTDTTVGGYITFGTVNKGTATSVERMRINSAGNIGIGVTTFGTLAAKVLGIGNGTAPTSSPADMVQLWASDSSAGNSELWVRDEAGHVTQLSEHASDAPEWLYDGDDRIGKSYNVYTGIITYTNKDRSERLAQSQRLGKQLPFDTLKLITFYQETFAQHNKRTGKRLVKEDWEANQNKIYVERQKERAEWAQKKFEHDKELKKWKALPFGRIPAKDRIEKPEFNEPQPKSYTKKQRPRFLRKK